MTAIVTSKFRTLNAENFKDDIASAATSVYVAIGKSDVWSLATSDTTDTTPFTPYATIDDLVEARENTFAMKLLASADSSHVVPRHTWTTGTSYVEWDSNDPDMFDKAFYVITSEFKVYKVIYSPGTGSTQEPTQTLTDPTAESDSYIWKYMYTVAVADAEKFLTTSYMPVKTVSTGSSAIVAAGISSSSTVVLKSVNESKLFIGMRVSGTGISGTPVVNTINGTTLTLSTTVGGSASAQTISADTTLTFSWPNNAAAEAVLSEADYAQYLNQLASTNSATAAGIERIEITAAGTSYETAPTVIITGAGTGATATATVSGGVVTAITVTAKGTDYSTAHIVISGGGGSDATARAVLSPENGHGVDPVKELGGFFAAVNTLLDGAGGGDLTVGNDFRQITLLKNPANFGTSTISTSTTLKATSALSFLSKTGTFVVDELITQGSGATLAQAFVVEVDAGTGYVYYNQNSKTGYGNFIHTGGTVTGATSGAVGTPKSAANTFLINPEVDIHSGDIIFLENRNPIDRTASQIEDIKIIIEF